MWLLMGVAFAFIIAHEAGHVVTTKLLGGHWLGVECRGFLVGVRLALDSLTPPKVAATLAAGSLAEALVAMTAMAIWPRFIVWWATLLLAEWAMNLIPWGFISNDGTRLWKLLRTSLAQ